MDRTQVSETCNAGSIPAERIEYTEYSIVVVYIHGVDATRVRFPILRPVKNALPGAFVLVEVIEQYKSSLLA